MDFMERKIAYKECPHKCHLTMNHKEKPNAGTAISRISHFPKILVINLMRFRNNGSKLTDPIVNNLEFDLSTFAKFPNVEKSSIWSGNEEEKSLQSEDVEILHTNENQNVPISAKYTLQSIIVHRGLQSTSGHYFAICRNIKGEYWKYDDNNKPVRIYDNEISNIQAYILIYELE